MLEFIWGGVVAGFASAFTIVGNRARHLKLASSYWERRRCWHRNKVHHRWESRAAPEACFNLLGLLPMLHSRVDSPSLKIASGTESLLQFIRNVVNASFATRNTIVENRERHLKLASIYLERCCCRLRERIHDRWESRAAPKACFNLLGASSMLASQLNSPSLRIASGT